MDVDVDFHVSLFDFLISGVLIWGMYKGYMQGVIVQAIALFALLAGVFICSKLSIAFYNSIIDKSMVALPNLPIIIFAIMFGFVGFFSNYVALKVQKEVMPVPKGMVARGLGAFFSAVKYAFIISVFLIFVDRIDKGVEGGIITDDERRISKLYSPFLKLGPAAISGLRFNVKEPEMMQMPETIITPK